MKTLLSLDRFETLLGAYGARLELWPESERAAARALLESSPEARRLCAAEEGLDALFTAAKAPELAPELGRKLAELPLRHPRPQKLWPFRRVWLPALGWAAAAAFGVLIGTTLPADESAEALHGATAGQAVEPTAPDALSEEEQELLELAFGPTFELEEAP
jgi:hypothetical protein